MKNFILTIIIISIFTSCKKDIQTDDGLLPDSGTVKPVATMAVRFEPEHKNTETEGTVTFNNSTHRVVTTFTDRVAFKQEAVNQNGQPDVLHYREKLVYIINSSNDTITLDKALFKKQLPDYNNMILQNVLLNHQFKTSVVPLLVYFCMPDSDYCFYFDVAIGKNKNLMITEVDEENFED